VFIGTEQTTAPPVETKSLEQENLAAGDCVNGCLPDRARGTFLAQLRIFYRRFIAACPHY
jgi:hypothetical protein